MTEMFNDYHLNLLKSQEERIPIVIFSENSVFSVSNITDFDTQGLSNFVT